MTDNKSYLLRAIYEWIEDNHCTPYLYIDTSDHSLLTIPGDLLGSNPLVFNISEQSCHQLTIDNDVISFEARFSGVVHHIVITVSSILAIIAKENGQGMHFEVIQSSEVEETTQTKRKEQKKNTTQKSLNKKSKLKLIE